MRIHRFYINKDLGADKTLIQNRDLIHQWRNVFRYNVGSEILLFDGKGEEYLYIVETMNNREAWVRLLEKRMDILPSKNISLYISLIKRDNLEVAIQKTTELGISKIIPVLSERSEKKSFNLERAKRIAIEASEQCGRLDIPEIGQIMDLESCIMNCGQDTIVFDPSGDPLRNSKFINHNSFSFFIGPEGGWSPREIQKFKDSKIKIFSLGKLVLRTETAAIVASSLLTL